MVIPGRHRIGWLLILALGPILLLTGDPVRAQSRRPGGAKSTIVAGPVRSASSANFRLVTDLSEKEAEELLQRLETMLKLVSNYFGKRNIRTIDMYVAEDLSKWPSEVLSQMDPDGIAMIQGGAGVTLARTAFVSGRPVDAMAVVYAVANHGTPQHEAVHAYCQLAFGRCGPVWYAEGMAEVGQYWRENDKGVKAPPEVINYLRGENPKPLDDIVNNPLETTGDSWQNYAWRWALCHLLGFNENYTERFKPLGLAMLNGKDVSFASVYGSQAAEIQFEYELFLDCLTPGYRVDLCSWDWKAKPLPLKRGGNTCKVLAGKGWQPARMQVTAGQTYQSEATGEWKIDPTGNTLTAEGNPQGNGRLVGCIFHNYQLSEEFDLGASGAFTAPVDGALFVRCRDDWGSIHDNKGTITCRVREAD